MHTIRRALLSALLFGLAWFVSTETVRTATLQDSDAAVSSKTWLGREAQIEAFLKVAEVVRLEPIGIGVTSPNWMYLAPGGLFGVYPDFPTLFWGLFWFFVGDLMEKALWKLVENARAFSKARWARSVRPRRRQLPQGTRPCATRSLPERRAVRDVALDCRVLGPVTNMFT